MDEPSFFARSRKAFVAALTAFVGSLLAAARAGTVWGPNGLNWAAVGVAMGAAVAAFAFTWMTANARSRRDDQQLRQRNAGLAP